MVKSVLCLESSLKVNCYIIIGRFFMKKNVLKALFMGVLAFVSTGIVFGEKPNMKNFEAKMKKDQDAKGKGQNAKKSVRNNYNAAINVEELEKELERLERELRELEEWRRRNIDTFFPLEELGTDLFNIYIKLIEICRKVMREEDDPDLRSERHIIWEGFDSRRLNDKVDVLGKKVETLEVLFEKKSTDHKLKADFLKLKADFLKLKADLSNFKPLDIAEFDRFQENLRKVEGCYYECLSYRECLLRKSFFDAENSDDSGSDDYGSDGSDSDDSGSDDSGSDDSGSDDYGSDDYGSDGYGSDDSDSDDSEENLRKK